ncbi:MAG: pseudouridine synthase [bacterium]|nr:pseudouridine synthase [bacterium]
MWINKYLASEGYTTRRGADVLVKAKKVLINGRVAVPTDKVNDGDKVEVKGFKKPAYQYYAYNKPRGEETASPLPGLFPLGRLDKDSQGLLILTNDGRVTDRLLSPKYEHDKEYEVKVEPELKPSFKTKLERGVNIEGYVTKKCQVTILTPNKFKIILHEGKKHQIRRMCAAFNYAVRDLKRTRIMNIKLAKLGVGQQRVLKGDELKTFLISLGL